MRTRVGFRGVSACIVAAALLGGCRGGDELPRHEVKGTVTLDGQPLETGTIQFQPEAAATAEGVSVSGGALIAQGRYRIGRDQGLVPGTYKVMIFSHSAKADESAAPGARSALPPELIPARYNATTTLTAAVSKDGTNVFDFDLKK